MPTSVIQHDAQRLWECPMVDPHSGPMPGLGISSIHMQMAPVPPLRPVHPAPTLSLGSAPSPCHLSTAVIPVEAQQSPSCCCRWRDCYSDEHYFPTLLASLGKDLETDCVGQLINVDWSRGGAHPRAYLVREVSAARYSPHCSLNPRSCLARHPVQE